MRSPQLSILLLCFVATGSTLAASADAASRQTQVGLASYVSSSRDGEATASGMVYDEERMTAAHRTLPFGTRVRVTNLANGRHVVVTITDRGPFRSGRIIDVSKRAASKLGFVERGIARVRITVVEKPRDQRRSDPD